MMAASKLEFVGRVPEELTCPICVSVLREPQMMNCCEKQYCKSCLEEWFYKSRTCPLTSPRTCPTCRSVAFNHMFMQQTDRRVKELEVYCPNREHGCDAILKFGAFEQHLFTTCCFVTLRCQCSAEIFRCQMGSHLQRYCPSRLIHCQYCNLQGEHQHITGVHQQIDCPLYPVHCPRGCNDTVPRNKLQAHRKTCPMEPVPCLYSELGCRAELCRRDLKEHVDSGVVEHMTLFARSHAALQAGHAALQAEHEALKADYRALQTDHGTLKADYEAQKADYKALKADYETQKTVYGAPNRGWGASGYGAPNRGWSASGPQFGNF